MSQDLARTYRPTKLDELIGQRNVVAVLKNLLDNKWAMPHAFIIQGIAGCGKTTIARIIASELGCNSFNVLERSGGLLSTKEAMTSLISLAQHTPMGKPPVRAIIINEAEKLPNFIWDTLYEALEEPSSHTYWFICTTDITAIPAAIKTRCTPLNLYPVRPERVRERLDYIAEKESFTVSSEVRDLIAHSCEGSVRLAVNHLSLLRNISDLEEAKRLLDAIESDSPLIKSFCSGLSKYITREWGDKELLESLFSLRPFAAAEICSVVVKYWTKVIQNSIEQGYYEGTWIAAETILQFFTVVPNSWGELVVIVYKWQKYLKDHNLIHS